MGRGRREEESKILCARCSTNLLGVVVNNSSLAQRAGHKLC